MSHDWSKALGLRKDTAPDRIEQGEHTPQVPNSAATHGEKPSPPWRPNRRDFEEVDTVVKAQHIRSTPLQYGSLADMSPDQIDGIERTAMVGIRKTFDQQGLTLDERTLRAHWAFVVEGYGFPMPEGYIHPEAPPETAQEAREGWARSVQGAANSVLKQIFCTVWRRRRALPPPAQPRRLLTESDVNEQSRAYQQAYAKLNPGTPVQDVDGNELPKCGPCNTVFPTEEDLRRHVDQWHPLPESRENDFKILGEG